MSNITIVIISTDLFNITLGGQGQLNPEDKPIFIKIREANDHQDVKTFKQYQNYKFQLRKQGQRNVMFSLIGCSGNIVYLFGGMSGNTYIFGIYASSQANTSLDYRIKI